MDHIAAMLEHFAAMREADEHPYRLYPARTMIAIALAADTADLTEGPGALVDEIGPYIDTAADDITMMGFDATEAATRLRTAVNDRHL